MLVLLLMLGCGSECDLACEKQFGPEGQCQFVPSGGRNLVLAERRCLEGCTSDFSRSQRRAWWDCVERRSCDGLANGACSAQPPEGIPETRNYWGWFGG